VPDLDDVVDDGSVEDATDLLRLINKEWIRLEESGRYRVSSAAFCNSSGGALDMSVVLDDTLREQGRSAASLLDDQSQFVGVVALQAGFVRTEEQKIRRSPTESEPAHGGVIGRKNPGRRKRFAEQARWVQPPE
jgi:hypothetical protein